MKIKSLLFIGGMLPLVGTAQEAAELDYTFVEASYLSSELDAGPFNLDGDGLGLKGSLSINEQFFVFADYVSEDFDGFDVDGYDLGGGMRWALRPELDLVADVSWVHVDVAGNDDDGLGLGVGLRSRVHEKVEVEGGIRHVDLDDSETSLLLRGRYYFTDNVSAGLGLDLDDDHDGWSVGIRAEFGN